MKKLLLVINVLLCALFVNPVNAALNLTLTQGVSSSIPIAVVPFSNDNNLSAIVSNDMNNSGKFKALDPSLMPAKPTDAKEVNFDQWKNIKQNDVVVGTVSAEGNQYRVHFQLLDVYKGGAPLLDQSMVVSKNQLRQAAHRISDLVYQALTGTKGFFSTRIAYILNNQGQYALEVADYDGFNPRAILVSNQPILSPAWSHDGKKIAYVSYEKNNSHIYISTVATGARRLVTNYPGINGAPAFSPHDNQLALVLSKEGNTNIFIMNLSNNGLTQLTSDMAINTEPSFAPDGQSLLFTSDRGGSPQVYRMTLGSRQVSRVTFNGNYNARASFSPDGSQIVMLHSGGDTSGYGIGLQDLQSNAFLVLDNSGDDQSPSFAPNGQMVIFAAKDGMHRQLALVSTDGRIKLRLPSDQGDVQEPVWSPFLN
jgi:TolB protein